ncbi:type II toxin-antitoxin system RelE/ParE family toxin [Duganella sp. BJB488]|uniref:type II toxin-antitoxin system RelE/ParE family toxin n=1 Tax=unclassified Duganella TaxID=2636909 RepID=UPI000E3505B8|nr:MULTISPECIES: type II toxin-antitoxin system RelE/ParE family toxin [unclassified Duganella]RFP23221.1 type II toxin-antitoxin system RelE/ParE family toxin [Duganella sp. BJB489]RFP24702.1 type II toxin-antitoxin system RelE/ParE family toxin [Duganella sp. BJB488]RFP34219.1 type II toxin-antitoxin system RelE/ParE family toxin [Duganella sp. BJB480]
MSYQILHYFSSTGHDEFGEWLRSLRDPRARGSVSARLNRLAQGNFGDHRYCRDGVWELRVNVGAGYRIYYALAGGDIVLLLAGGGKATQAGDIVRACDNWKDWRKRKRK